MPWEIVFYLLVAVQIALVLALTQRRLRRGLQPPVRRQPAAPDSVAGRERFFSAVPRWIPIAVVTFFVAMIVLILAGRLRGNVPLGPHDYWSLFGLGFAVTVGVYYQHCLIHRPNVEITADEVAYGTMGRRIRVPIERIRDVRRTREDRIELETDDRIVKLSLGEIAAGERDAVVDAIRRRVDAAASPGAG